jgi:hypothetical protein
MSRAVRIYEQWRAAEGRPVPRRLSLREQARKLRARAAEDLATAAEIDEAADAAGEPK